MFADWRKHGVQVIEHVRQTDPVAYLRVVAGLIRHAGESGAENAFDNMSDDELRAEMVAEFAALFPEFLLVPAKRPALIAGPKKAQVDGEVQ